MNVKVIGEAAKEEIDKYVDYCIAKYSNRKISELVITIDGDYADLTIESEPVPFDRIRRITGYLVGSLERWNNAKRAEERDRVKHGM